MKHYCGLLVPLLLAGGCAFEVTGTSGLTFSGRNGDSKQSGDGGVDDGAGAGGDAAFLDQRGGELEAEQNGQLDLVPESIPPVACVEVEGQKDYPECDDGLDCTYDWCHVDTCKHTPNDSQCPGADACKSFTCSPAKGCVAKVKAGAPCEIATDKCVVAAQCSVEGECQATELTACPPDQCREEGSCQPETGECLYLVIGEGLCDDLDPCTIKDSCVDGQCVGKLDPASCSCGGDDDCLPYEDGDLCNGKLKCITGLCQLDPTSPIVCPASPPEGCYLSVCDPSAGTCVTKNLPVGESCSDGNECTVGDQCDGGGKCKTSPAKDGASCDLDGNLCTSDSCLVGKCQAGPTVVCTAPAKPCVASVCQPESGLCVDTIKPNGSPCATNPGCNCDMQPECVKEELCFEGLCLGGVNVCADCYQPANAGHPCDDGSGATVGDLCVEQKCRGFSLALWSGPQTVAQGIERATAIDGLFHLLGWTSKVAADLQPLFLQFTSQQQFVGPLDYSVPALSEIDGKVAAGPADKIFYNGINWTSNSQLTSAIKVSCPKLGTAIEPAAAAFRRYDSGGTSGFTEMAAVGFRVVAGFEPGQPLLALCGKQQGSGGWICGTEGFMGLVGDSGLTSGKPRVTAIWLPPQLSASCSTPNASCFQATNPAMVAVEATPATPNKTRLYLSEGMAGEDGNSKWSQFFQTDETALSSGRVVRQLSRDAAGNTFACGDNAFLYSRPSGSKGFKLAKFVSLGEAQVDYLGVYRSATTTLILTNLRQPDEGGEVLHSSGLLGGPPGLLLSQSGPKLPWFRNLAGFSVCPACEQTPGGRLGFGDLATSADHPSLSDPPGKLSIVGVGTVPLPTTGQLAGLVAILTID